MNKENYIPIHQLGEHYQVEVSFFVNLQDFGLIELITIDETPCVPEARIVEIEKMIRMHHDLEINFAGIDTVINLLERIDQLQNELIETKNKLRLYDDL